MALFYIHIPFCSKACHYCNFHFSTQLKNKSALLQAILTEIEQRKDYLNETIETIYFGGGTPSLLTKNELEIVINAIHKHYTTSIVECAIEANPDDLTKEKINDLYSLKFNRLSIGVQSFFDNDLQTMNRSHNSNQATQCVRMAQDKGFDNISIDLMYGLPNQTLANWQQNIQQAIDLRVQHISSYSLTVEEGTALAHFIKHKKSTIPSEESYELFYNVLCEMLEKSAFEHYELSNFAKDKKYSMHNIGYWHGKNYIGVGPSAHSYNGVERRWNIANNALYEKNIGSNNYFENEILSYENKHNEYIMTRLRTQWGIDLHDFESLFDKNILLKNISKIKNHFIITENNIRLKPASMLISDSLFSELFI